MSAAEDVVPVNTIPEPSVDTRIPDISWGEAPRLIGSGLCMGTADLVPGVSGGTMAVALGIYRKLLAAITSINARFVRALLARDFKQAFEIVHWRFILCLGTGIGLALIIMGKIFKLQELVITDPKPVYSVFLGLVLASTGVLARRIKSWSLGHVLALVVGTGLGFLVVNLVPVDTPEGPHFVFLYGAIAICAMILPGISGSFILLILNKYEYIISGIIVDHRLDIAVPFALGCAIGLMAFSRVLGWLLDRWHDVMIASLTGLLLGSLWRIWPYQNVETAEVRGKLKVIASEPFWPESLEMGTLGLVLLGLILVFGIEVLAMRRRAV